ncbi:cytochrome C [Ramlibacter sp. MMS24-I3-19]|uniref:cytochrome C n=1 Tax=Ramlibacter sp. MMS24-I3-19 TaxID=3416606 RepID=UPI003D085B6B
MLLEDKLMLVTGAASGIGRAIAVSAALLLGLPPLLAQEASGAGPSRGQLLYDAHCIQCHTTQMHWRDARVARDWSSLRKQVEAWQARIGERWTTEDVDAVARHLNATIYHYPVPSEQASADATSTRR